MSNSEHDDLGNPKTPDVFLSLICPKCSAHWLSLEELADPDGDSCSICGTVVAIDANTPRIALARCPRCDADVIPGGDCVMCYDSEDNASSGLATPSRN